MYTLGSASMSEVFTRVAYQLIKRDFMVNREHYFRPTERVAVLSRQLHADGFRAMSAWVLAYAVEMQTGETTAGIRRAHLRRALRAPSWRHVVHAPYKASRNP